jgi:outer membrane lipoprotein-sorting protein
MRAVLKRFVLSTLALGWLYSPVTWAQNAGESAGLEHVLIQMDAAARNFKSAEANVVQDQYDQVIKQTDTEKGKIYFRREGSEVQMAANFLEPDKKDVIYSGGKLQEYSAGKNRSEFDSFVVLGFGGSGHDLQKSFDLKFLGSETIGGIATQKLELIPKSARLKNNIARILLWIDPARGVSVQQQFFEPAANGDYSRANYRLVKYSDIQMDQKISDSVFKLKTTGKTEFLAPQG